MTTEQAREELAYTVGVQAYLYGYPSVEMYRVRWRAVFDPENKVRVALNQFRHRRELVDHTMTLVVAPNNDTLYSSAWLDLSREPVVLDVPDTQGRYYVMQFMDFYSNNFAYVGKRTTGTRAGSYAITPPGWNGSLPAGVKRIEAPGKTAWLLGRTLVNGRDDLPAVQALQDRYRLTPISAWMQKTSALPLERPDLPPLDPAEPLRFFEILNAVLRDNPPPPREAALMSLFGQIGVGPGKTFSASELDAPTARGLRRAIDAAQRIIPRLPTNRPSANGWLGFAAHTGRFGDDYAYRAYVARYFLAANDPDEAHNFSTRSDSENRPLNGSRKYVLRFEKGQRPPVQAFWSITMYGVPGGFLIDNPIGRYSFGDRTKTMQVGSDGALEIYVQHDSPGRDKESNWLPAPSGDFELALRCYMPDAAIVRGSWVPPALKVVP